MISGMPKNKKQDPDFKPGATNNTYRSTYNKDTRSMAAQLQGIFSLRCELRTHMGNVTKRVLHVLYRSVYTAVWTRNGMCRDFFAKMTGSPGQTRPLTVHIVMASMLACTLGLEGQIS